MAMVYFASKRKRRDAAMLIGLHALAARGKPQAIKSQIRKLEKG